MSVKPPYLDPRVTQTYTDTALSTTADRIENAQTTMDSRITDTHSDTSNVTNTPIPIPPVTFSLQSTLKFSLGTYRVNCIIISPTISFTGSLTFQPDKNDAKIILASKNGEAEFSFEQELFNKTSFSIDGVKPSIQILGVKQTMDYTTGSTPISLASTAKFSFPTVNLKGREVKLDFKVKAEYSLNIDPSCIKDRYIKPGMEMAAGVTAALVSIGLKEAASDIAEALLVALVL